MQRVNMVTFISPTSTDIATLEGGDLMPTRSKGLMKSVSHPRVWDANRHIESLELPSFLNVSLSCGHDSSPVPSITSMEQFSPLERVMVACCGTIQHVMR